MDFYVDIDCNKEALLREKRIELIGDPLGLHNNILKTGIQLNQNQINRLKGKAHNSNELKTSIRTLKSQLFYF